MARLISLITAMALLALAIGCSAGDHIAVSPTGEGNVINGNGGMHQLWGVWQFIADPVGETLDAVPLRNTGFHFNALSYLEPPPHVNLTVESVKFTGNKIDVNIGLRHPFANLTQFTGFDVCGIFITGGSMSGFSDHDIIMAGEGDTRLLNPDGYSRWWNPAEFPVNTGTIKCYKDGLLGTPYSSGKFNSTINGYKYFCDDLDDPYEPTGNVILANRGIFTAGKKNVRHYTIELGDKGLTFNYAVDACWALPTGAPPYTAPGSFPPEANRPEAWRISVTELENTLFNNGSISGGSLHLSLDIYDWFNSDLNKIKVESPGNFAPAVSITPIGGGAGYSTYEVKTVNATPAQGSICLLISVVCEVVSYGNLLPGKTVTAYFSYDVHVSDTVPTKPPVCDIVIDPCSLHYWDITDHTAVKFDATGCYDPYGGKLQYVWDFDGDGLYGETNGDDDFTGTPEKPTHIYYEDTFAHLKLIGAYLETICDVNVDITQHPSKDIPLVPIWEPGPTYVDVAQNPNNGDLEVVFQKYKTGSIPAMTSFWTQLWKYKLCECYQTSTLMLDIAYDAGNPYASRGYRRVEISPTNYTILGGAAWGTTSEKAITLDPTGAVVGDENTTLYVPDVMALNSGGNYQYSHCYVWGWRQIYDPDKPYLTFVERSDYDSFSSWAESSLKYIGTPHWGYNNLFGNWVRATESAKAGDSFWVVKNGLVPDTQPDNYGARWRLTGSGEGSIVYDDAYFGSGAKTDSDEGFYKPVDLTRTSAEDVLIVLDCMSTGKGRLKAFKADGSGGQPIAAMDLPWALDLGSAYTCVRIDSSDYVDPVYGNMLAIVYGTINDGYHLSIFFPEELPW